MLTQDNLLQCVLLTSTVPERSYWTSILHINVNGLQCLSNRERETLNPESYCAAELWDHILQPSLVRSASEAVRRSLFALLVDAWAQKPAMRPRLRPPLLAFLGDAAAGLRGEALDFWHRDLPEEVAPRLQALLQDGLACTGPLWVRSRVLL